MENVKVGRKSLSQDNILSYIGKTFGCFKVLNYHYMCVNDAKGYDYFYMVECTACNRRLLMSRSNLQKRRYSRGGKCASCFNFTLDKDFNAKCVDTRMRSDKPRCDNMSTGVKHYYIYRNKKTGKYIHSVVVMFDGKNYKIFSKTIDNGNLDKECLAVAKHLNTTLANGGRQAFFDNLTSNVFGVYDFYSPQDKLQKAMDRAIENMHTVFDNCDRLNSAVNNITKAFQTAGVLKLGDDSD